MKTMSTIDLHTEPVNRVPTQELIDEFEELGAPTWILEDLHTAVEHTPAAPTQEIPASGAA